MQRLLSTMSFSRVVVIVVAGVIAILVGHSFTYWVKYRTTASELSTTQAQLVAAQQANIDNLATIEFQRSAIQVRDNVLSRHIESTGSIDSKLEDIQIEIKAYEPEERTDEIECLDLRPPSDLIDRLQSPTAEP